jgi:hypothetical protein
MDDSAQRRRWKYRVFRVAGDGRDAWRTEGAVEVADGSGDGLSGRSDKGGGRGEADVLALGSSSVARFPAIFSSHANNTSNEYMLHVLEHDVLLTTLYSLRLAAPCPRHLSSMFSFVPYPCCQYLPAADLSVPPSSYHPAPSIPPARSKTSKKHID